MFSDCSWPQVMEIALSETVEKGGLLYISSKGMSFKQSVLPLSSGDFYPYSNRANPPSGH